MALVVQELRVQVQLYLFEKQETLLLKAYFQLWLLL